MLDYRKVDIVSEIRRLTDGGFDMAIEALGTQKMLRIFGAKVTHPSHFSTFSWEALIVSSSRSATVISRLPRPNDDRPCTQYVLPMDYLSGSSGLRV